MNMKEITNEELKHVLDQHQLWLNTDGKEGHQADLSNVNLSDKVFNGTNFSRAILTDTCFKNAIFHKVNFEGAWANRADFSESFITNCTFKNAQLTGADFWNINIWDVNFSKAHCKYSDFSHSTFTGDFDFTNADFEGAKFYHANLPEDFKPLGGDPPRDADDRPSVIEQLAEKKAEAPDKGKGGHGRDDPDGR